MINCKTCGKPTKNSSFCSRKCRYQDSIKLKICSVCGIEFKTKSDTTKYCSNECRHKGNIVRTHETRNCKVCGTEFSEYKKSKRQMCSDECRLKWSRIPENKQLRLEATKKAVFEKYGVDVYFALPEAVLKSKKTRLEKYGDENYTNPKKVKQTKFERHGDENYVNVEKNKQTKKEKYGDENYNNRDKFKKTMVEEYSGIGFSVPGAVEHYKNTLKEKFGELGLASPIITEKKKQTCLQKYGVEFVSHIPGIDEKRKKTHQEKFGVDYYPQHSEYLAKSKKTSQEKYGTDFYSQTDEWKNKIKLNNLEKCGTEWVQQSSAFLDKRFKDNFENLFGINGKYNTKLTPMFDINEYKGVINPYKFKCKTCGHEFIGNIHCGIQSKCRKCEPLIFNTSKFEKEILTYVQSLIPNEIIIENSKKIIHPHELDIYIPSRNLAIECNGIKWHSEEFGHKDKKYHLNKTERCRQHNIRLIHITDLEWSTKNEIVKSKLAHILNSTPNKIYARNTTIKEIDVNQKQTFLNKYHLQGGDKSKIKLGLFDNDNLVAVMTLQHKRVALGNKKQIPTEYELVRYATSINVVGGFSKLLKHFIKTYAPTEIISYADRRWSEGNVYLKNGFTISNMGQPNYWYIEKNGELKHRFKYRKTELPKKLSIYDPKLTEWENMKNNKFDRIWDCGNIKFEMKIN